MIVGRPFREFELRDEDRLHPPTVLHLRRRQAYTPPATSRLVRLVGFDALRDWECFDGDTGKDSARGIREYFIADVSNWKDHDSYQKAFQRLVSDLKAEASK